MHDCLHLFSQCTYLGNRYKHNKGCMHVGNGCLLVTCQCTCLIMLITVTTGGYNDPVEFKAD